MGLRLGGPRAGHSPCAFVPGRDLRTQQDTRQLAFFGIATSTSQRASPALRSLMAPFWGRNQWRLGDVTMLACLSPAPRLLKLGGVSGLPRLSCRFCFCCSPPPATDLQLLWRGRGGLLSSWALIEWLAWWLGKLPPQWFSILAACWSHPRALTAVPSHPKD